MEGISFLKKRDTERFSEGYLCSIVDS